MRNHHYKHSCRHRKNTHRQEKVLDRKRKQRRAQRGLARARAATWNRRDEANSRAPYGFPIKAHRRLSLTRDRQKSPRDDSQSQQFKLGQIRAHGPPKKQNLFSNSKHNTFPPPVKKNSSQMGRRSPAEWQIRDTTTNHHLQTRLKPNLFRAKCNAST